MQAGMGTPLSERRADIDHLRVIALALLIVYHVLLVFNSWDWWRVKSEHAGLWADYLTGILTPWRMSLVFFVGGVAARYMFDRVNTGGFIAERASKLLTAFVFAVIVLIPLQRYVRLDETGQPAESYINYLLHHARFAVSEFGIWLPDFAHAWFLPYLFVYSAMAAIASHGAPRAFASLQGTLERAPLWALVGGTMAWFAATEALIWPQFPVSGLLFPDLGAHAKFAPVFFVGVLLGKSRIVVERLVAHKVTLSVLALGLLTASLLLKGGYTELPTNPDLRALEWLCVRGLYGGVMLYAVLALAAWGLNKPSKAMTYATDAILPVYLMHQTVLIVTADLIVGRHWPVFAEWATIMAATVLVPLAAYHVLVRHVPPLRVLFGLRPHPRRAQRLPEAAAADVLHHAESR